jgi:phage-related holin
MEQFEVVFKTGATIFGGIVGLIFGESTGLLVALFWMSVIDYGSGVIAGYTEKTLAAKLDSNG